MAAFAARQRREIDNAAAACVFRKIRDGRPRDDHHAFQVDGHDFVPKLAGDVLQPDAFDEIARVVDEHVQAAEKRGGVMDHLDGVVFFREIGLEGGGALAGRLRFFDERFRAVFAGEIVERDVTALTDQFAGDRLA